MFQEKPSSPKGLILILLAFIMELLNIPYIEKNYIFIFHIISALSFGTGLYFLSKSKLKGFIWCILGIIVCGKVNILGLITISLLFLFFNLFYPVKKKELLSITLILTALIAMFFYDIIFLDKTLKCTNMTAHILNSGVYGQENNYVSHYPVIDLSPAVGNEVISEFIKKSYRRGNLPLWNPYQACGYPAIGVIAYPYFNPFDFILHIFPSKYSWDIYDLLRILLAGLFLFLFMREMDFSFIASLSSALTYMFSSPVIIYITDIQMSSSMLYPLFLLSVEKLYKNQTIKEVIITSLVILLMIFSGFPEHVVLISLIGTAYFIFRIKTGPKKGFLYLSLKNYSLSFILGISLGLIVIIPFAEYLFLYTWTDHHPDTGLKALDISGIFGIFIPYYKGEPDRLYMGVIPWLLALIAFAGRKNDKFRYFWGISLLIIMAKLFGLPLINWIGYLPIINLISFIANTSQCMAFIIAILAGAGMENLYKKETKSPAVYILILLLLIFITIPWSLGTGNFSSNHLILKYIFLGGFLSVYLLSLYGIKIPTEKTVLIILVLLSAELFSFIPRDRLNKLDSFPEVPYIKFLKKEQENKRYRSYGIMGSLSPNVASAYEIDDMGVYMNLCDNKYAEFFHRFINKNYFVKGFFPAVRYNIDYKNKFLNMLNLGYLILPFDRVIEDEKWEHVYSGEVNIYKNKEAFSRVILLHKAVFLEDDETTLNFLKKNADKLKKTCIITGKEEKHILKEMEETRENSSSMSEILSYDNDEIIIDAYMEEAGFLVLNDLYYEGWKVFVNNKEEKIYRANFLFRGVFLPEGEQKVRFVFFPYSYYISKIISLMVMFLLFIIYYRLEGGKNNEEVSL